MAPSEVKTLQYYSKSDWAMDRYGQAVKASFPEKVTEDAQLRQDVTEDQQYYNSLAVPSGRDRFGGLADSEEPYGLSATGYFSIQQADGRTVMVTPDGNVFFSLGVNVISSNETYTQTAGREKASSGFPGKPENSLRPSAGAARIFPTISRTASVNSGFRLKKSPLSGKA
ncbi:hypothetical protein N6H14_21400 [Paenibacillus sp. CC-CFT747]|nr:hypothetical protein N6H14_21400 [Paenibacillus sp. CC-CFT747]